MPANIRDDAFIEQLARSIHADYVAKSQARGETEAENRSMVSWEQLPRDLQDANVAQAAGIGAKLEAINAVVVPESAEASDFSFTPGEIDGLAEDAGDRADGVAVLLLRGLVKRVPLSQVGVSLAPVVPFGRV